MDIADTLAAKSDQANADDFIGGPQTVTITGVKVIGGDQPVSIFTSELGADRPYKPCLTMRRAIVDAWGADTSTYTGRRMTLYRDASVKWAGEPVGGLRISHLSHIDKPLTPRLTETRGKKKAWRIDPLPDEPAPTPKQPTPAGIIKAFADMGVTVALLEARVGGVSADWSVAEITSLAALGKAIKAGETSVAEAFDGGES